MKKPLSRSYGIVIAFILTCVLTCNIAAVYAGFSDRDSKNAVTTNMATVDIELSEQLFTRAEHDKTVGTGSFSIINNSNISIYLRAGLIFELTAENGEPVIADTSKISIISQNTEWRTEQKEWSNNRSMFSKWFLIHEENTGSYAAINPGTNPTVTFTVTGIPVGCKLLVNIVPEAIQADTNGTALSYLKDSVNVKPAW